MTQPFFSRESEKLKKVDIKAACKVSEREEGHFLHENLQVLCVPRRNEGSPRGPRGSLDPGPSSRFSFQSSRSDEGPNFGRRRVSSLGLKYAKQTGGANSDL